MIKLSFRSTTQPKSITKKELKRYPIKIGDLVAISILCPTLEVVDIVKEKCKVYAVCVSWLEQKYYGKYELKDLVKCDDDGLYKDTLNGYLTRIHVRAPDT